MDSPLDPHDLATIQTHLYALASAEIVRVTLHAQQEMLAEDISFDDVLHAIHTGQILENYPEHQRGSCCLLYGHTLQNEPLHIVCTTIDPVLILITAYRPMPPKWQTPWQRGDWQ